MVRSTVILKDIKPIGNAPSKAVVQGLIDEVARNRALCRDVWWNAQKTLCLDNKDVIRVRVGMVKWVDAGKGSGKVIAKTGRWVNRKANVSVKWADGTISQEICIG